MSLNDYLKKGYLHTHKPSKKEIAGLLRVAERDLRAAEKLCQDIDWQFAIAYNAALQLATVPIRASGYRAATKSGHHWITFVLLPLFLGNDVIKLSSYFDECRLKRNFSEYTDAGNITPQEAVKLIHEAKTLKKLVLSWLKKNYPLLPE